MKWTREQEEAIYSEGKNIIVSAGAGSGKTAVLTERVIRKLKDNVNINELLVLTFTNEAANEMKTRIRKAIKKDGGLDEQLNLIDNSYITTFDSFALSIVKKYHYLLNIPKELDIVDSSLLNLKVREYIDIIFDDLYNEENSLFLKLIDDFCVKDDNSIKDYIININKKLDLLYDKDIYLDNYINNYYSDQYINNIINDYMNLINDKLNEIKKIYNNILECEEDKTIIKYEEALSNLLNSSSYDDIKNNINVTLPRIVKYSKEEKNDIKSLIDEIKVLTMYDSLDYIKNSYMSSKSYIEVIINIIKKLDILLNSYKRSNNVYDFVDISKMSINILKNNDNIRLEISDFYNEIMVDEYQDTNDLQEMFISLIEKNNLYMVGDIKQSIYRFRNANPSIFKNKYDLYRDTDEGIKIDLFKNFRSRREVLEDINNIFDKIMDDEIGGAKYSESHRMVFGLSLYEDNKMNDKDNYMNIYNYEYNKEDGYSNKEDEIFIIANDIINKINNNYKVLDKESNTLRNIKYSDFCIMIDRAGDFDLIKKIFEFNNIPLNIYKDEKLTSEYDILIIKNLINLIIKVKNNIYDKEFKYYFTSILRSYLYGYSDNLIFDIFINNKYREEELFKKCEIVSKELDYMSAHSFLERILDEFNFFDKVCSYKDLSNSIVRINYLLKASSNLEVMGYTPYSLGEYLTTLVDNNEDVKYKVNNNDDGAVKLMTIHHSKGLEFPVCYFPLLNNKFNLSDIKDKIFYDNKYGIVTPYIDNGEGVMFTKHLVKHNFVLDEVSEKIRLFYVALTRAREKIILVCPLDDNINNELVVSSNIRSKYNKFSDIVNDIKNKFEDFIVNIDLNSINRSKDYKVYKDYDLDFLKDESLKVNKINNIINIEEKEHKSFSKSSIHLVNKEEKDLLEYGTYMHYMFETSDLLNPKDEHVIKFVKHNELSNISDAEIYKEYEFKYRKDNTEYNGVIDLLLIYPDYAQIIDYKLSNTSDSEYVKQLNGYKEYIENKLNKKTYIYLYSIMKDEIISLN